jgi:hypothetical protein
MSSVTIKKQKKSTIKTIKEQANKMENKELKKIFRVMEDYRIAIGADSTYRFMGVNSERVEIGESNARTTANIC